MGHGKGVGTYEEGTGERREGPESLLQKGAGTSRGHERLKGWYGIGGVPVPCKQKMES